MAQSTTSTTLADRPLSRVLHLVEVAINARTSCMLSRLVRTRNILLVWSLVHYVYAFSDPRYTLCL